jgi:hypothetical protein
MKNKLIGVVFRKFEAVGFGCARGQGSRQNDASAESDVHKVSSVYINSIENFLQTVCGQAAMKSSCVSMGAIRDPVEHANYALGILKANHL